MAASIKKLSVGVLVVLLVTLVVSSSFTNADKREDLSKLLGVEVRGTEFEDFKIGMPLYRLKNKPGVLIPAYKLESLSTDNAESP